MEVLHMTNLGDMTYHLVEQVHFLIAQLLPIHDEHPINQGVSRGDLFSERKPTII